MARLNVGWDCTHITGIVDKPHCPKLKTDIEGYKVGFIIEKDEHVIWVTRLNKDTINITSEHELVKIPVIIKLSIKKGTRVTSINRVISDREIFTSSILSRYSLDPGVMMVDNHQICKKRCSLAFVDGIYSMPNIACRDSALLPKDSIAHSYFSPSFTYYTGKRVNPTKKFCDIDGPLYECASGIHFFSTPKEAFDYYNHWCMGNLVFQEYGQETLKRLYDKDLKLKEKINKKVINNAT